MSRRAIYLIFFLFAINICRANVPEKIVERFRLIVKLIEQDKSIDLSKIIAYPLIRQNPLPNVKTQKEFIKYYPTLIDKHLKNRIRLYQDSDIFEHHGSYGLVGGLFMEKYGSMKMEKFSR